MWCGTLPTQELWLWDKVSMKQRGRGKLGNWDWHIHATIYQIDKQQGPTVSHREGYSVFCKGLYGKKSKEEWTKTSLVATLLRICLAMQGTQVPSLVGEAKIVHALQQLSLHPATPEPTHSGAHVPQLESPHAATKSPVDHNEDPSLSNK